MAIDWTKTRCTRSSTTVSQGANTPPVRTGRATYWVKLTNKTDGPQVAETVVALGASYSAEFPLLKCTGRTAEEVPERGGDLFEVTVDYSDAAEPGEDPEHPVQDVEFTFTEFTEDAQRAEEDPELYYLSNGTDVPINDSNFTWPFGKAVCSSAGTPFDPSIEETYFDPTIIIDREEADWDWARQVEYQGAVNEDDFTITYRGRAYNILAGTAWMRMINAKGTFSAGTVKFQAHYEIIVRKDGWIRKVKDESLMEFHPDHAGDNGKRRHIKDGDGEPVQIPVQIVRGEKQLGTNQPAYYIGFKLKKKKVFGDLAFA